MSLDSRPSGDFETWEAKKVKILAVFKPQTENQEIVLGDGRPKDDIDRPIRMGTGKSRLDQLERRATTSRSHQGTLITAKDFTS